MFSVESNIKTLATKDDIEALVQSIKGAKGNAIK
jgi:hypothetical protein